MKKLLSIICTAALAVMCAVPAFAEATPGEVANTSFEKVVNAQNQQEAETAAKEMTASVTENPTVEIPNYIAVAASNVINASSNNVVNRVRQSEAVSNYITFEAPDAGNITVQSLTQQSSNTWVLRATASSQPEMGVLMALYGLGSGSYQLVYVDDNGNRTTYNTQIASSNSAVVFWIPHFSTYEIVKVASASTTTGDSSSAATTTTTTAPAVDAAAVDAQFYTCPACGYHNWTGTVGGYKCDHCGHIEAKDLSSYPNVKGTATLPSTTASAAAASGKIIKATGADMSLVVLAVLAVAAALVAGFACIIRKQGLGK